MLTARLRGMCLSHAPLPVDSYAPEYTPPRTGRAQAVHRGKRGKQWQAARDGHWLGCWRVLPRFYASDQACSPQRQGTLHVARRRSTAGAVSCDWECCVVRRASESAVMVSTSCCEQRSGARRAGGGRGGGQGCREATQQGQHRAAAARAQSGRFNLACFVCAHAHIMACTQTVD